MFGVSIAALAAVHNKRIILDSAVLFAFFIRTTSLCGWGAGIGLAASERGG